MSSLRDIVKINQEELALKKFLGKRYGSTSPSDKKKFLDAVKDTTNSEVERILNAFIEDALKGSPVRKRKRNMSTLNLILTSLLTTAISYSVNIENWVVVTLCSLVLVSYQTFMIFNDN